MGQQQSLNCKNNSKDTSREVQTNQANALLMMRNNLPPEDQEDDFTSKKTTPSRSQVTTPLKTSTAKQKPSSFLAQHQNIVRISGRQFGGAEKMGQRWVESTGKSLAQIIEGRYNSNMYFPQNQVVVLLQSLVYALAYMQKNNLRHHDFYPTNVYYNSGSFKISNPSQVQASSYTLTQERQRFSFLAPELIAQIIEDTPFSDIPTKILYKADIFAIGMIMLEFCTLEQSSECYDQENYSIVDKIVRDRIQKVQHLYSPRIADCIQQMLQYDVEQRVGPEQLALAIYLQAPGEKIQKQNVQQGQQGPQKIPQQGPKPQQPPPQTMQQNVQNMQYLQVPGQRPGGPPPLPPPQPGSENSVAMPLPNYQYSRIGPNNQSLLSSSSLQNKLKLIQKIQQTPQQEEQSQGMPSMNPSRMSSKISQQSQQSHEYRELPVQQQHPQNPHVNMGRRGQGHPHLHLHQQGPPPPHQQGPPLPHQQGPPLPPRQSQPPPMQRNTSQEQPQQYQQPPPMQRNTSQEQNQPQQQYQKLPIQRNNSIEQPQPPPMQRNSSQEQPPQYSQPQYQQQGPPRAQLVSQSPQKRYQPQQSPQQPPSQPSQPQRAPSMHVSAPQQQQYQPQRQPNQGPNLNFPSPSIQTTYPQGNQPSSQPFPNNNTLNLPGSYSNPIPSYHSSSQPSPTSTPPQSKPSSPHVTFNNSYKPPVEPQRSNRGDLLNQPSYYQRQNKPQIQQHQNNLNFGQPYRPNNSSNGFTPKILQSDQFQFDFKQKFPSSSKTKTEPTIADLPSFKPTKQSSNEYTPSQPKFDSKFDNYHPSFQPDKNPLSSVPAYHSSKELNYTPSYTSSSSKDTYMPSYQPSNSGSSTDTLLNKYGLSFNNDFKSSGASYKEPLPTWDTNKQIGSNNLYREPIPPITPKQSINDPLYLGNKYAQPKNSGEGGQTLEQRVDRILQISRSIK